MAMKICKGCGEQVDSSAKACPKCGKDPRNFFMKHKVITFILVIIVLAAIGSSGNTNNTNTSTGGNNNNTGTNTSTNNSSTADNSSNNSSNKNTYGFNETFEFDNLEITIGSDYTTTTVSNQFSEHNGSTVVKVPITVKNLSSETHSLNMFYYSIFGSKGTELDSVSSYFDDSVDFAGELRNGASYTKYLYFLYDGNGTYAIEFDNFSTKVIVEFNI